MPETDINSNSIFNNEQDGEHLVKASALFAAFSAYHQRYLADKSAVMHYKGSVANMDALYALEADPTVTLINGDIYNVIATGENFAYKEVASADKSGDSDSHWDRFGAVVDLTGYATEQYVNNAINSIDFTDYALKSEIPDDTSDLTNGAGFQTAADVASAISGKVDSASLATIATTGSYNDLTNTPDLSIYTTEQYVNDAIDDALEVIANGSY